MPMRAWVRTRVVCGLWASVVLVVAALVGVPGQPAWAAGGEAITAYDIGVVVRTDGRIAVTETIGYDFGTAQRHGILRRRPSSYRYDDTRDRLYPVADVAVWLDDGGVPVERSDSDGNTVLQIGEANRMITGRHTYVVAYVVSGALNRFPDHDELYWNAIGDAWSVPIAAASVTVRGPGQITQAACFAGPTGSRMGCAEKTTDGGSAHFAHAGLGNGLGLTVVVAFPPGSISTVGPFFADRHDLTAAFHATPVTVGVGLGLALLGGLVALTVAWFVGRDRRFVGLLPGLTPGHGQRSEEERRPLVGLPPVSVEFGAPDRIRPGQVGTLIDERAHVLDVTATIVDFAVRKYLHIRELRSPKEDGAQDWELTKLRRPTGLLPHEGRLFWALFHDRDSVRLSELKRTFGAELTKIQRDLDNDIVKQGWYRRSPEATRRTARRRALAGVATAIAVTVVLAITTQVALIGVGLVLGASCLVAVAGRMPARTGRGSAMLERVKGLRLYISQAEAEQIAFQERERILSEFLPYAMVFGLVEHWAKAFAGLAASGVDGEGLYWYSGRSFTDDGLGAFDRSFLTFATMTTAAVASASVMASTTPSAAGVSGLSSGGFSGGGAGGGGGGSWEPSSLASPTGGPVAHAAPVRPSPRRIPDRTPTNPRRTRSRRSRRPCRNDDIHRMHAAQLSRQQVCCGQEWAIAGSRSWLPGTLCRTVAATCRRLGESTDGVI